MKWQDKFLTWNEEENALDNEFRAEHGENLLPSYREIFSSDGRLALFYSYPTSRDVDITAFPELDFTKQARDELALSREVTDLLNQWLAEFGKPLEECREDRLAREGKLEEYLLNELTDSDRWKNDE